MLANIFVGLVALIHLYILWLEMFAWTSRGRKVFNRFPTELFEPTKALAANQGLYNGFLAAGLIWSFFIKDIVWQDYVRLFFLFCIAIAGIYGALSADKKIFFVQALPALIAIALLIAGR
jgi:putative membrane protein